MSKDLLAQMSPSSGRYIDSSGNTKNLADALTTDSNGNLGFRLTIKEGDATFDNVTVNQDLTVNGNFNFGDAAMDTITITDDGDLAFGDDEDFAMRFDSGNTQYEFENNNNNNIFTVQTGTIVPEFQGDVQIATDSSNLLFGAGQDSSIKFDGTDTIFDYDKQNSGTASLRFQKNGTSVFNLNKGGSLFSEGDLTIDNTTGSALLVRKEDNGGDVLNVDTNNSVVQVNGAAATSVNFAVDGNWEYQSSSNSDNGMSFEFSSTDEPVITPIVGGAQQFSSQLRYNITDDTWDFEPGVKLRNDTILYLGNNLDFEIMYDNGNNQFEIRNGASNNLLTIDGSTDQFDFLKSVVMNSSLNMADDQDLEFGNSNNFSHQYNTGNSQYAFKNTNADNVYTVDDGTQIVDFTKGITTGGNVGINTTSPSTALDVNGNIRGDTRVTNEVTIADDSVHSFTPAKNFGKLVVQDGNAEVGEILFDISNGAITEISDLNGNIATSTSSLAGTTGTDGNLIISADGTNTQIDIENRLGGSRTVRYNVIA